MRTLGAQLALTTTPDQSDLDLQLPLILMTCRSAVQESTGCTPALLMLGRELRTPPELAYGRPPDAPDHHGRWPGVCQAVTGPPENGPQIRQTPGPAGRGSSEAML